MIIGVILLSVGSSISIKEKLEIYINDDEGYKSPPPAPRYRYPNNSSDFVDKYFNKKNIPNKYSVNHNK